MNWIHLVKILEGLNKTGMQPPTIFLLVTVIWGSGAVHDYFVQIRDDFKSFENNIVTMIGNMEKRLLLIEAREQVRGELTNEKS